MSERFMFWHRRKSRDEDLERELRDHLEAEAAERRETGTPTEEARYAAQRILGNRTLIKEDTRAVWASTLVERLAQDARYAFRILRKDRVFSAMTLLTLGLGIGVNTTIFSLVSAVMLRKPPVANPDRLMMILGSNAARGLRREPLTAEDAVAFRAQNRAFHDVAAFTGLNDFTLTGYAEPAQLEGMSASANYFRVLGARAMLGRTFLPEEDQPGHEHVVVLSHEVWEQRFGSDPHMLGKAILLNGQPHTVIGIMPPRFRAAFLPPQLWAPLVLNTAQAESAKTEDRSLFALARLNPGITAGEARAEAAIVAGQVDRSRLAVNKGWSATAMPLQQYLIEEASIRPALIILMGAVGFVLLIACANVANLLMARTAVREREMAVRTALGAGRLRLMEQLLVECLLLGFSGGACGLILAVWGVRLLRSTLDFNEYMRTIRPSLDWRVLLFTLIVSLATVLLFGLRSTLRAAQPNLHSALKEGTRGGSSRPMRSKTRNALVIGEIALAIFLLAGAGLMIDSFVAEMRDSLGFNAAHVLTAQMALSERQYDIGSKQAMFFRQLLTKLQTVPGVVSAGVSASLPATASAGRVDFSLEGGSRSSPSRQRRSRLYIIGGGYLKTMGIPLLKGRDFNGPDRVHPSPAVLVNQAFADRFLPQRQPLGERVRIEKSASEDAQSQWLEVVGVVGNVKDFFGQPGNDPQLYESFLESPQAAMNVVMRTNADPNTLAAPFRETVWAIDKAQPIGEIATMARVLADAEAGDRIFSVLLGIFAMMALALASVGIYGTISYAVAQRTQEIGVRMALGAEKSQVAKLLLIDSMWLTIVGLAIGLTMALSLPGLLGAMFVGLILPPSPFVVFTAIAALVVVISLLASYFPARRAMRVDPMVALRYE